MTAATEVRVVADRILTDQARRLIEAHKPPRMSMVRVARELEQFIADNPSVLKCTARSIVRGLAKGVTWNLELGKTWHLVPLDVLVLGGRGAERKELRATALQDYKGQLALMQRRRDVIKRVDYSCVFEQEAYKVRRGTDPMIEHWSIMDVSNRGELVGGYALAEWVTGGFTIVELDRTEVDAVRKTYSKKWKRGELDGLTWYVEKTCVHRLAKRLDLEDLRDDSDASDTVLEHEDVGDFTDVPDTPVIAPGSREEKRLLGVIESGGRRNPGARSPLATTLLDQNDPYGLMMPVRPTGPGNDLVREGEQPPARAS